MFDKAHLLFWEVASRMIIFLQNGGCPLQDQHQWKFELIQGMYS